MLPNPHFSELGVAPRVKRQCVDIESRVKVETGSTPVGGT